MPKLTRKLIEGLLPRVTEACVWDTGVKGFGVRVRPSGAKTYVLMYRVGGKQRKHTLGTVSPAYPLEEARQRAAEMVRGLRDGHDPQVHKVQERTALTVGELLDLYLEDGPALKPNKKASSWNTDRSVFASHVRPLLGRRLARDLTPLDIAKFQMDVAEGKTAKDVKTGPRRRSRVTGGRTVAAMTTAVLAAALQFGVDTGRLTKNPARGVKLLKRGRRERFLSEREVAVIGEALAEIETAEPRQAVMADAVRLLILTGCRKSEILTLQWAWVDREHACLRLPDSKTGAKVVPLAETALKLLGRRWKSGAPVPPTTDGEPSDEPTPRSLYVLPAMKGDGHYVGLPHAWEKVKARADVIARRRATELGEDPDLVRSYADVRLHDLRHSFASFAIADGASLFMVGKVLGHKQARTTEIYAHLSDDPLKRLADRTGSRIAEAMRL